ncbi:hypothetical protein KF728_21205 [Candidatus Obscuribacterales bacterium]|nr:hypothetical protein [Candidatus Obscuribacterales bacterium]MBX3152689.1 hypothetical protein [Candidatus Obscuribacterales bacterium]
MNRRNILTYSVRRNTGLSVSIDYQRHSVDNGIELPHGRSIAPSEGRLEESLSEIFVRNFVSVLAIVDLLFLLLCKSALDNALFLTSKGTVYIDLAIHLCILGADVCLCRINLSYAKRQDPILIGLISIFALVVFCSVPAAVSLGVEKLPNAILHALLVVSPVISYGYICPRILNRRNFMAIFAAVLLVFSMHALLTAGLCISDTTAIAGREIVSDVGRAPVFFGHSGTFVPGLCWNPNTLAIALMMLPAVVPIVLDGCKSSWARLSARVAMILISCHLLLTFSRAAIFSVLLSFALWPLLSASRSRRTVFISMLTIVFLGIFLVQQALNLTSDSSMLARIDIWKNECAGIVLNPWGQGLPALGAERMPHSLILGSLQYFGFQGLFVFSLLLGYQLIKPARSALQSSSSRLLLVFLASVVIVHGTFEYFIGHPLLFANSLFWIMLGYLNLLPLEDSRGLAQVEARRV